MYSRTGTVQVEAWGGRNQSLTVTTVMSASMTLMAFSGLL
jgi:hypothetical protein